MATVRQHGKHVEGKKYRKYYKNQDALEKSIGYLCRETTETDEDLVEGLSGGYGIDMSSTKTVIEDMRLVKDVYGKKNGRQLKHFSVNLTVEETVEIRDMRAFAYEIASYYGKDYQIIFQGHRGFENGREQIHIHFCCNSVSYVTGKMFVDKKGDLEEFKKFVNEKVEKYRSSAKQEFEICSQDRKEKYSEETL